MTGRRAARCKTCRCHGSYRLWSFCEMMMMMMTMTLIQHLCRLRRGSPDPSSAGQARDVRSPGRSPSPRRGRGQEGRGLVCDDLFHFRAAAVLDPEMESSQLDRNLTSDDRNQPT